MSLALRKTAGSILPLGLLCLLAAGAGPLPPADDEYKIFLDGEEIQTKVPAEAKGRSLLLPGDLATKLGVSIKWGKRKIYLVHDRRLVEIKNDGGKKGGDVVDDVPRVPFRVLRDIFNINIRWDRVAEKVEVNSKEPYNQAFEPEPLPHLAAHGALIPDFTLPDLEGNPVSFSSFMGKRVALVIFSSWDESRRHLKAWQEYQEKNGNDRLQVVGVAVDAHDVGAEAVRRRARRAGVKFPILVDGPNILGRMFGFENVPVVIAADELGIYFRLIPRYPAPKIAFRGLKDLLKEEVRSEYISPGEPNPRATNREISESLGERPQDINLRLRMAEIYRSMGKLKKAIAQMESAHRADKKSAEVLFRWGHYLYLQKSTKEAEGKWLQAAGLEPRNWIVRKQIWAIRYPKRFYPRIDLAWQQLQIQRGE